MRKKKDGLRKGRFLRKRLIAGALVASLTVSCSQKMARTVGERRPETTRVPAGVVESEPETVETYAEAPAPAPPPPPRPAPAAAPSEPAPNEPHRPNAKKSRPPEASTSSTGLIGSSGQPAGSDGAPSDSSALFWGSWVGRRPNEPPISRIVYHPDADGDTSHYVTFVLTPYDLKSSKGSGSVPVKGKLKKFLSASQGDVELFVIPVLGGTGLDFVPGEAEPKAYSAHLERLQTIRGTPPTGDGWTAWVFDDDHNVLKVPVGIQPTEPGCATVSLAIWRSEKRPLDYVTRRVSVTDQNGRGGCKADRVTSMAAGFTEMMRTPSDLVAEAALQVYEPEIGNDNPKAVLLLGSEPKVWSWELDPGFADYLGGGSQQVNSLQHQVEKARCVKDDGDECHHDYSAVAAELTATLFPDVDTAAMRPPPDPDVPDSVTAYYALRDLINSSVAATGVAPTVVVGVLDKQRKNRLLPLGLLGIQKDLLGDVATITTPLPISRDPDEPCLGTWSFVLPATMYGVTTDDLKLLDPSIAPTARTFEQFAAYAKDRTRRDKPEGLILMAHHGSGRLALSTEGPDLKSTSFVRSFAPGSVAILAACSVARTAGDNQRLPLLSELNKRNIDAAIASPFDIDAELGARIAIHFAHEVALAQAAHDEPTVQDLFRRAIDGVRAEAASDNAPGALFRTVPELAELMIVGDASIRLCP